MNTPTILVTGATGTVGTALIPTLLERGVHIRAMTRDPNHQIDGAETVTADLRDPDSLSAALTGVDAAFLNSPSEPEAADLQIRFADLAQQHGVDHLVVLSQYAAQLDSPVRFLHWHAQVEAHLQQLALTHTVLRPNLYLQALLGFAAVIGQGVLPAPIGDAAVSAIDTRDISTAAAAVLTNETHAGRTHTLTGPRAITHTQIAGALAAALDRPVRFQDVTPAEFAAALGAYLPPWQVAGTVEDYAHYACGEAAEVTRSVTELTGHPSRDVTSFAADHAAAFEALADSASRR